VAVYSLYVDAAVVLAQYVRSPYTYPTPFSDTVRINKIHKKEFIFK